MRWAAGLVVVLGLLSAAAGVAIAVAGFAPIPFGDQFDFFRRFYAAGGWDGYGLAELYARHNEHRLVVPRIWFLIDLGLFGGTQALLNTTIVLSSAAHAAMLAVVYRALGHRGPAAWLFAGLALGAVLSPAQWENLVWGFQVQFVQVWLFATLAFAAVAFGAERRPWLGALGGVICGLASTYSMANGLLVWPLLVALALWVRLPRWPSAVVIGVAAAVMTVELSSFHAHPGHGDPSDTVLHPIVLLRYALRYLTSGVAGIGEQEQEFLGGVLAGVAVAIGLHALVRRDRFRPAHGVLLAVAAFVIGAALVTALGRVNFGLAQANTARYTTPSFIFMVATAGLLIDRLMRVDGAHWRIAGVIAGGALLLLPGLVDGWRRLPHVIGERDMRVGAVVGYLAGGYRPALLPALYPLPTILPLQVLQRLDRDGQGPFARRDAFRPPVDLRARWIEIPADTCAGHIDRALADPVEGVVVSGWAAATGSSRQPDWLLVIDPAGAVVAWGASRVRRDDVGAAVGSGFLARGFDAFGQADAKGPFRVVGLFADGSRCQVGDPFDAKPPRFLARLPVGALPAAGGAWAVAAATDPARVGEVPVEATPAVGSLGGQSDFAASITLDPPVGPASLAIPVRTGAYPIGVTIVVRDSQLGDIIDRHDFARPSETAWNWLILRDPGGFADSGRSFRVDITAIGTHPWQGAAVGRPYWISSGDGG